MNEHLREHPKIDWQEFFFWLSSLLLFLIIFSTNDRILNWLNLNQEMFFFDNRISTIKEFIAPIRGAIFIFTVIVLLRPVFQDLRDKEHQTLVRPSPWTAIFTFLTLMILLVPQGLKGLGQEYGSQSILIFERASTVSSYQRFLMPALGYVTFLRGNIFFFGFSLACTFGAIYLTHVWLVNNKIFIPFWVFVSVLTSSFIATQYQIPGYPDALIFVFLLAIVTFQLKDISKLSLIVLSIASHEASILLYGIFAIFIFSKQKLGKVYGLLAIYLVLWFGSEGFKITTLINNRPRPSATVNMSSLDWILNNPTREMLGIFFAYKLLWVFIIWALVLLFRNKNNWMALQIIALLGSGLFMTFLAIDTSRLMGWSFYALLLSIKVIHDNAEPQSRKLSNAIFLFNLLIPSAYVGLNLGMLLPPGLYSLIRFIKNWLLMLIRM